MLTFCLRLVLIFAVVPFVALGLSPAKASDYSYDIDFSIMAGGDFAMFGDLNFSGTIQTTCNQCFFLTRPTSSLMISFLVTRAPMERFCLPQVWQNSLV